MHRTSKCDALLELSKIRLIQLVPKLSLTCEDDLKMLGIVRLEIEQQPDLFEHIIRKLVGFIDNNYGTQTAAMPFFEHLSHGVEKLAFVGPIFYPEHLRYVMVEF